MQKQTQTDTPAASRNIFPEMEQEVLEFWDKAGTFAKSLTKEAPKGDYVFYDGPPFATGTPHYGHIVASTMKDVVPRYWTMRGYRVERRWGWDCHGLPIENIVEKELGSKHKKDIEALGVEKFNELCRSKVLEFAHIWEDVIRRMGRWADMQNPYRTMDLEFMESVWWTFKQLWDKGLIYESYRSMHICPRCETTLSQSEVSEGYKDIKDLSAIAKFELVAEPGTFVLAWTTTPWTLVGNVALAVGADIDYVKAEVADTKIKGQPAGGGNNVMDNALIFKPIRIIVAKDRLQETITKAGYALLDIISEMKGRDLVNQENNSYKPLFDYYASKADLPNRDNGWKIYAGDFVTTDDGTGVVHIAPAFGEDDMRLGKENCLPFVQHVGMDGYFAPEVADENLRGLNVKPGEDHTKTDIEIIKYLAKNGLLFHKEKYEHSYPHCWRCDTPLLNYATNSWFVDVTKIKERALELAKDINWSPEHIKQGRFGNWLEGARDWSISRQRYWASVMPIWRCSCGELRVFGSAAELEEASGQNIDDLHKHIVDKVEVPCGKCGQSMRRVPDVLDTWFDSGSMPYAQMHYPFDNKDKFEANFPAQFIAEGVDQTRCWFYYLHIIATGISDSRAFSNVIVNGIVLAEDGKKMSKKLKNYPDTSHIFEHYSADAMRHYLMSSPVVLADNLNFSESGVKDVLRNVCMTLWNVYNFYALFAAEGDGRNTASDNPLDAWIVSKLNATIREMQENLDRYNLPRAARQVDAFINELSTWYIRRSRDRFKGDDAEDKQKAIATTKHILQELAKAMAPFTPFIAEQLWQKVSGYNFADAERSVHLEDWPEIGPIDEQLLADMELVRKVIESGLAERDKAGIKIRQPLARASVRIPDNGTINPALQNLITDELNIKSISFMNGDSLSVELDTAITPELKAEGIQRDFVRLANTLRKQAGLTISDRIRLTWHCQDSALVEAIESRKPEIMDGVLANSMDFAANDGTAIRVEGQEINITIKKI